MDTTVTQWVKGEKPEHVGVYESGTREINNEERITGGLFQHWNGIFWGVVGTNPSAAYRDRDYKSSFQDEPWRGLAVKP